jgi:uncharacterized membrane protein YhhN
VVPSTPIAPAAAATAALLALHLVAERRGAPLLRAAGKLGASAVFVALGVTVGTGGSFRGPILAALLLSAVGDGLLLSARKSVFLAGLVAFLLAHVAYAVAFAPASRPPALAVLAVVLATLAALRWLWPKAGRLRAPVAAYCAVIAVMVSLALGVPRAGVRAGALLFWLSDLAVARNRFVAPAFANRLVGLPLYYAAQLLLASAAG